MAKITVDSGGSVTPLVLPDAFTMRQAGAAIAVETGHLDWWYGDWQLFCSRANPSHRPVPGEEFRRIAPDERLFTIDGFVVVLGWIQQPEVWN